MWLIWNANNLFAINLGPFQLSCTVHPHPAWITCSSVCIIQSCSLQVCEERYVIQLESLCRAHPYKKCCFALCAVSSLVWLALCSFSHLFGFFSLIQKISKFDVVFLGSCRQACVSYLFLYFLLLAPIYGAVEKQTNRQTKNGNGITR